MERITKGCETPVGPMEMLLRKDSHSYSMAISIYLPKFFELLDERFDGGTVTFKTPFEDLPDTVLNFLREKFQHLGWSIVFESDQVRIFPLSTTRSLRSI